MIADTTAPSAAKKKKKKKYLWVAPQRKLPEEAIKGRDRASTSSFDLKRPRRVGALPVPGGGGGGGDKKTSGEG